MIPNKVKTFLFRSFITAAADPCLAACLIIDSRLHGGQRRMDPRFCRSPSLIDVFLCSLYSILSF